MRKLKTIVVHCSASDNPNHDDISVIDNWHKQRGWRMCGYHRFIKTTGEVQTGRRISEIGAHVKGHNDDTIGICLHGSLEENFTEEQFEACASEVDELMELYPSIDNVVSHNFYDPNKTCPNFNIINKIMRRIRFEDLT